MKLYPRGNLRIKLWCFRSGVLKGKSLNNSDRDQVLWARETEHPSQTFVFTKTAGRQPGWRHGLPFEGGLSERTEREETGANLLGQYSLIWPISGYAAGQSIFFLPLCPRQGIYFAWICPKQGIYFRQVCLLNKALTARLIWFSRFVYTLSIQKQKLKRGDSMHFVLCPKQGMYFRIFFT